MHIKFNAQQRPEISPQQESFTSEPQNPAASKAALYPLPPLYASFRRRRGNLPYFSPKASHKNFCASPSEDSLKKAHEYLAQARHVDVRSAGGIKRNFYLKAVQSFREASDFENELKVFGEAYEVFRVYHSLEEGSIRNAIRERAEDFKAQSEKTQGLEKIQSLMWASLAYFHGRYYQQSYNLRNQVIAELEHFSLPDSQKKEILGKLGKVQAHFLQMGWLTSMEGAVRQWGLKLVEQGVLIQKIEQVQQGLARPEPTASFLADKWLKRATSDLSQRYEGEMVTHSFGEYAPQLMNDALVEETLKELSKQGVDVSTFQIIEVRLRWSETKEVKEINQLRRFFKAAQRLHPSLKDLMQNKGGVITFRFLPLTFLEALTRKKSGNQFKNFIYCNESVDSQSQTALADEGIYPLPLSLQDAPAEGALPIVGVLEGLYGSWRRLPLIISDDVVVSALHHIHHSIPAELRDPVALRAMELKLNDFVTIVPEISVRKFFIQAWLAQHLAFFVNPPGENTEEKAAYLANLASQIFQEADFKLDHLSDVLKNYRYTLEDLSTDDLKRYLLFTKAYSKQFTNKRYEELKQVVLFVTYFGRVLTKEIAMRAIPHHPRVVNEGNAFFFNPDKLKELYNIPHAIPENIEPRWMRVLDALSAETGVSLDVLLHNWQEAFNQMRLKGFSYEKALSYFEYVFVLYERGDPPLGRSRYVDLYGVEEEVKRAIDILLPFHERMKFEDDFELMKTRRSNGYWLLYDINKLKNDPLISQRPELYELEYCILSIHKSETKELLIRRALKALDVLIPLIGVKPYRRVCIVAQNRLRRRLAFNPQEEMDRLVKALGGEKVGETQQFAESAATQIIRFDWKPNNPLLEGKLIPVWIHWNDFTSGQPHHVRLQFDLRHTGCTPDQFRRQILEDFVFHSPQLTMVSAVFNHQGFPQVFRWKNDTRNSQVVLNRESVPFTDEEDRNFYENKAREALNILTSSSAQALKQLLEKGPGDPLEEKIKAYTQLMDELGETHPLFRTFALAREALLREAPLISYVPVLQKIVGPGWQIDKAQMVVPVEAHIQKYRVHFMDEEENGLFVTVRLEEEFNDKRCEIFVRVVPQQTPEIREKILQMVKIQLPGLEVVTFQNSWGSEGPKKRYIRVNPNTFEENDESKSPPSVDEEVPQPFPSEGGAVVLGLVSHQIRFDPSVRRDEPPVEEALVSPPLPKTKKTPEDLLRRRALAAVNQALQRIGAKMDFVSNQLSLALLRIKQNPDAAESLRLLNVLQSWAEERDVDLSRQDIPVDVLLDAIPPIFNLTISQEELKQVMGGGSVEISPPELRSGGAR